MRVGVGVSISIYYLEFLCVRDTDICILHVRGYARSGPVRGRPVRCGRGARGARGRGRRGAGRRGNCAARAKWQVQPPTPPAPPLSVSLFLCMYLCEKNPGLRVPSLAYLVPNTAATVWKMEATSGPHCRCWGGS